MGRLNPGRLAAVRALIAVEEGGHAEDLLGRLAPTEPRDRGLAWHLVLGVLRKRGTIDAIWTPFAKKGADTVTPGARAAIRMGVFELILCRTPTHAAVQQAVEACRRVGEPRAVGFVNAILRKATKASVPEDAFLDLPEWLQERWNDWGEWVSKLASPAPLSVCMANFSTSEGVALLGDGAVPATVNGEEIPGVVYRPNGGLVDSLPGFEEGQWWIMDPSAAKVADIVWGEVAPGQAPSATILDACASPGGKTFRLMSRGAKVTAVDASHSRLETLHENCERLRLEPTILQHDWEQSAAHSLDTFDVVLVDAPCSALGVVRRHPEIRWSRLPSDPAAMSVRQRRILRHAAEHVSPEGALVYAVCSPCEEEGKQVVETLDGWTITRTFNTCPPKGDEDAFQAFVLRRDGDKAIQR